MRFFTYKPKVGDAQNPGFHRKRRITPRFFTEPNAKLADDADPSSTHSMSLLAPQGYQESEKYELALILAAQYVKESEDRWADDSSFDSSSTVRTAFPIAVPPASTCPHTTVSPSQNSWLGSARSRSSLLSGISALDRFGNQKLAKHGRTKVAGGSQAMFTSDGGSVTCGGSHLNAALRSRSATKAGRQLSKSIQWVRRLLMSETKW